LALFVCIVPFFLLSKKYKGRFFSLSVFLLIMWLVVPLLLTQDYLFGLYVDSVRFLYFLIYPVIILFAVVTVYASRYFAKVLSAYYGLKGQNKKTTQSFNKLRSRILARIKYKTVYAAFLVCLLLILLFALPIFRFPWDGVKVQSFYQVKQLILSVSIS
jgi:fumarate reductase subunit C